MCYSWASWQTGRWLLCKIPSAFLVSPCQRTDLMDLAQSTWGCLKFLIYSEPGIFFFFLGGAVVVVGRRSQGWGRGWYSFPPTSGTCKRLQFHELELRQFWRSPLHMHTHTLLPLLLALAGFGQVGRLDPGGSAINPSVCWNKTPPD